MNDEWRNAGETSDCPAYLAVTITDILLYDRLFSYDLLVLRPATFNVSFCFPTSRSTTQDSMTSSFDVHLSDASKSYHVYVTHVDMRRLKDDDDDDDDQRSEAVVFSRRGVSGVTASSWDHSWLFYVVAVVIVVLALLSAFLHAERHLRPASWIDLTPVTERLAASPSRTACSAYRLCGNGHAGRPSSIDHTSTFYNAKYRGAHCRSASRGSLQVVSRRRHRLLLCAYATLWLVAGLLATFNVFFFVVSVLVDSNWRHLAAMTGDGQADMARVRRTAETNFTLLVDRHRHEELRRYRDSVVERLYACRNHVDNTIRHTSATLASESAQTTALGWSIAALTAERVASRLSAYDAQIDAFTVAFQAKLSTAVGRTMRRYESYVNSLVNSVWLRFAVDVFNLSREAAPRFSPVSYYALADQAMAEFGSFLDVDEVQQIEIWVSRFWQRYVIRWHCLWHFN